MARECGIRKITWFPLLTDEGSAPTYGPPLAIKWAVSLETKNNYSEGQYFADSMIEKSVKKISSVDVKMEVSSDLPPVDEAKFTGVGYKDGKKFTRVGQNAPAGALAYEILMDDETVRRRIVYNVGLSKNEQKNSTSEDKIDGATFNFEGIGTPLASTGDVELIMDEKEVSKLTPEDPAKIEFTDFFTKVVMPDQVITPTPLA